MPQLLTTAADVLGLYALQYQSARRYALVLCDDPGAVHIITPETHRVEHPDALEPFLQDWNARAMHLTGRDEKLIETALGRSVDLKKAVRRINQLKREALGGTSEATAPGGPAHG